MALDGYHDAKEILGGYESGTIFVTGLEGNLCILVMEIVQELRELCICDDSGLFFSEIQFDKVTCF